MQDKTFLHKSDWLYVWFILLHKYFTYDPSISMYIYVLYVSYKMLLHILSIYAICIYICAHTQRLERYTSECSHWLSWVVGLQIIYFLLFAYMLFLNFLNYYYNFTTYWLCIDSKTSSFYKLSLFDQKTS